MPHAWCSFYGFQCSSCLACKFLHKFVQCLQLREIDVSMIWYCLIQLTHEIIPLHFQKLYWFLVVTAFPLFDSLQIMIKNNFLYFVWLENQWTCEMGNQLTGIAPSQIQPVDQYLTDIPDYQYENRSEDFILLLHLILLQDRPNFVDFNYKVNFFWNIMITITWYNLL